MLPAAELVSASDAGAVCDCAVDRAIVQFPAASHDPTPASKPLLSPVRKLVAVANPSITTEPSGCSKF
jgi:hypothetical protein